MSSLVLSERRLLEGLFEMGEGYVLDFSNRTFGEFVQEAVGLDIDDDKYSVDGVSKAKRLRAFWRLEPDHTIGTLLHALIDYVESLERYPESTGARTKRCREIADRLLTAGPNLDPLKEHARIRSANHLAQQIRRIEASVEADPTLAIGTAKELIETTCKTILAERRIPVAGTPDIPTLTKRTLKELKLLPEGIPHAARGADVLRRLLSNLGTIGNGLAELRGLYGTGHGKDGKAGGLAARHARLAVGTASALATFLFETHREQTP